MLRSHVTKLDAVIFTHPHKDHIAGLDDIRGYNFFSHKAMEVYSNELTQQALRNEFHYIFSDQKYPGIPAVNLHTITGESFIVGDIPVQPIKVWHLKMPVLGFRFGNFCYITDANKIDAEEKEKIKGSEILILNALRHKHHISHFTLSEAIALADELKIPQAYFTHISHQLGLHEKINKTLPTQRQLAYDLQEIIL